eukprot:6078228-Alexandrium_andersonii.AAC.1
MRQKLAARLGRSIKAPPNRSAIEWDGDAQEELKHHPEGPECKYSNIASFFREPLQPIVRSIEAPP